MKEREDLMSTFFGTVGLFALILAVGCIDGGYNGVPVNDIWLGFFGFTVLGISSMLACLVTQKGD